MTGGGQGGKDTGSWFEELADPISRLTLVDWGFAAVALLSAAAFIWVMGAPPDKKPPAAAIAIAVVGLAAALAIGATGPRPV